MDPDEVQNRPTSTNRILIWAPTSRDDSNEHFQTPGLSKIRRASFTDKHPLLAKLEEAEEDIKHCDYAAHLLIQQQTREYAFAVEDAILLLKKGTEQITENAAYWRGMDDLSYFEDKPYLSWIKTVSGAIGDEDITRVGKKVVIISEAIKSLQLENALAFWTSEQRDLILQLLVTVSKDIVKLRRKLERIKETIEDRLRSVRRVAIQCECEITGNLVPSEIYYQWVKEDEQWQRGGTVGASNLDMTKNCPKSKLTEFKKAALNLVSSCTQRSEEETSTISSSADSEAGAKNLSLPSTLVPLKVYFHKTSTMKREVRILQRLAASTSDEDISHTMCTIPLEKLMSSAPFKDSKIPIEEVWSPRPSKKYMDIITANVTMPNKFPTTAYIYDSREFKIKEDTPSLIEESIFISNKANLVENKGQNANQVSRSTETENPQLSNNNANNANEEGNEGTEKYIVERESPTTSSNIQHSADGPSSSAEHILSNTMKQQIFLIKKKGRMVEEIINQTTWAIRGVERMWLSPPEHLMKNKKSPTQELYKLVDFIVDTAKLTENTSFASRIYPEDKQEIVSVLDPVLRELTNCYMSIYVLYNFVVVDANYLKELLVGFPKGNLVVRDWDSDPSIDEELAGLEQVSSTRADFDVDVLELFE